MIGLNQRGGMPPAGFERSTVIGGGPLGASWMALLLANGLWVRVLAHGAAREDELRPLVGRNLADLEGLGLRSKAAETRLEFAPDLGSAIVEADVILKCGVDQLEFVQDLWVALEVHAKPDALLISADSNIPAREQAAKMSAMTRVVGGQSPPPPHLHSLIEVATSPGTDRAILQRIAAFFHAIGKVPVLM